jgi:hypothetical protein
VGRVVPRTAQVVGELAGQPELGMGDDDQPGPAVGGVGVAQLRGDPAEGLFEQTEGVFEVEAAQERLPEFVHIGRFEVGGGGPQPQRFRVAVAGQMINA